MPDYAEIAAVALPAFVTLFVAIDPPGLMPMFLALTPDADAAERRRIAGRAVLVAAVVLGIFAVFGKAVLELLGISMPAFRIAGGIMLFLIAVDMLFEKRTERRTRNAAEAGQTDGTAADDVAVFPLGVPLTAGPGAIAAVVLLMSEQTGNYGRQALVAGALVAVLVLTAAAFYAADRLGRLAGPTVTKALTRVLGIILGALAVQFVLTGLARSGLLPAA